jgi:putative NADPH-quinone reductase
MSNNILVVSGHTDIKGDSLANKTILEELSKNFLPEAEYNYLSIFNQENHFDLAAEQAKLIKADVIVLQYPVFWYSTPSILSKWFEDVFIYGFSHGDNGEALKGKKLIVSLTTGAPEVAYTAKAGATIEDLLAPIRQTAGLTQLDYQGHIVTYGMSYSLRNNPEFKSQIIEKAYAHAKAVAEKIKTL